MLGPMDLKRKGLGLAMHFTNAVVGPATGLSLKYEELIKNPLTQRDWDSFSSANEFG